MQIPVTKWFERQGNVSVQVRTCSVCQCAIKDGKAFGEPMPLRLGQSHTWCSDCWSNYLMNCGLPAEYVAKQMAAA